MKNLRQKHSETLYLLVSADQWRTEGGGGGGGGVQPPPRNSEGPSKLCQTQPDLRQLLKLLNLGSQHTKTFGKKGSKILIVPWFAVVLY